jgi:hypothetical protein
VKTTAIKIVKGNIAKLPRFSMEFVMITEGTAEVVGDDALDSAKTRNLRKLNFCKFGSSATIWDRT